MNKTAHEQIHPDDWEAHWRKLTNITQFNPADEYRYTLVIDALALPSKGQGSRVLDAGCGTGTLITQVRAAYPRADLLGIDFSNVAISYAQRMNPGVPLMVFDLLAKDAIPPAAYERWATHC